MIMSAYTSITSFTDGTIRATAPHRQKTLLRAPRTQQPVPARPRLARHEPGRPARAELRRAAGTRDPVHAAPL